MGYQRELKYIHTNVNELMKLHHCFIQRADTYHLAIQQLEKQIS